VDSRARSVAKALTWRAGGLFVTMLVAWLLTRRIELAASIGIVDTLFKLGAYYVHERVWQRIRFGQSKPPEYEI
jgi:uncharacterized membrane protein